jgi:hypothetical protein
VIFTRSVVATFQRWGTARSARSALGFTAAMLILALATPSRAVDWYTVGGYMKSFVAGFDPAEYKNADEAPPQEFIWASNNRARVNAALYAREWLEFDLSYDLSLRIQDDALFETNPFVVFQAFSIYRVDDLNPKIWPDDPGEGDHVALFQNLDRLYVTVRAPTFDVIVGRQAIAWGSAKAINPTDILAPFLYTEIDIEDRIGVDAARVRIPAGLLGEVDVGYVSGEGFKWEESAAFVRGKFYAGETDFALIGMAFRENALAGIDVTRAIGGAGTWCEAAYVWADAFDGRTAESGDMDYLRLSVGADYSVKPGVYMYLEYHFNGAGTNDPNEYFSNILSNPTAYADGAVYFLGRHYLLPGASWQATPLTSLFAQVLANLSDGSFLFAPYFEYNATDNLYLSLGGYVAFGESPEAFILPFASNEGEDSVIQTFNSEFGAYPSQYYAFLRYYF